ncbi:MAG: response regulator transcription factor [Flavobacteriales bacterium]|nr:response regulator transcription factor [Flavobacteriales bacterium]MCB9190256.1 response regulator transcription factor [Flavobacteriales bacterium]
MIRVLITDDHEMIRNGLSSLIRGESDIHVVETAENGLEAVEICEKRDIDVALMDVMMPVLNGVEATKRIKETCPKTKVLAVTINDEPRFIKEVLTAGASGYILKHSSKDEILKAIRDVANNKHHFGNDVLAKISSEFTQLEKGNQPMLTKKEAEVLKLIAQEFSNQEIAEKLGCGIRTVDTHKRNLIRKLEVKNVVGLVKYALKMGVVQD